MKLLILCPLPMELEGLATALRSRGYSSQEERLGPLLLVHFSELNLRLSLAGHGKTQFGIQAQFLLDRIPEVEAVVCAGCAGALSEVVAVHDVVVAEKTIEHDFKLRFVQRSAPEFPGDKLFLKQFQLVKVQSFKVHFGVIASGDEDVVDPVRRQEIFRSTQALAVAWEGAGGARACKFNRIPFVEVRGITDTATLPATEDFSKNLKIAMENVATVLMAVLADA